MKTRNVTLSLPEPLLQEFRVYAAKQNQSMTAVMTNAIRMFMQQDSEREAAKKRIAQRLKNPPYLGTGGVATWTRDELHER